MNNDFDIYDIFVLIITNELVKYLNEINPFLELNTPVFNIECKKESEDDLNIDDLKSVFNLIKSNKNCLNVIDYLSDLNKNANMFSIYGLKIIIYYNLNCSDIDNYLKSISCNNTLSKYKSRLHLYIPEYNTIEYNYSIEEINKIQIYNCSLFDLENTLIELFPKDDEFNIDNILNFNNINYEYIYKFSYLNIIVDSDNNLLSNSRDVLIYKFLKLNPIKVTKLLDCKIKIKNKFECDSLIKSSNSLFSCEFDKWIDNCLSCIDRDKLYTYISNKYKISPIYYNKEMINSKIISKTSDHLKEWLNNLK